MAYWFQLDGINCDILQLLCGFSALYLFIFCLFVYILVYPFNRLLACWLAFRLAGLRVCGLAGSRACFWAPNSGVLIQLQVWHRSRRFPRFKLWLYLQTCKQNECVTVRTMLACMLMTLQLQVYLTLREWRAWQQAKPRFNHVCKNLHVGLTCVFPFSEELEEYCVPSWGRLSQPSQTGLLIFLAKLTTHGAKKTTNFAFDSMGYLCAVLCQSWKPKIAALSDGNFQSHLPAWLLYQQRISCSHKFRANTNFRIRSSRATTFLEIRLQLEI